MAGFRISDKVRKSASGCKKRFECLFNKDYNLCEVTKAASDDIIFIKPPAERACMYKISFGLASYICNCPVRKAIYRKYRV